jgi:hypothetical protein
MVTSSSNLLSIYHICPSCNHTLFRGPLSFGPGVVKCKKCHKLINTGLACWSDLSFFKKAGIFIKEVFAPSFLNADLPSVRLVYNFIVLAFSMLPVGFVMMALKVDKDPSSNILPFLLALMWWYPFWLIIRILRLRSQSNKYLKKGQIPNW